MISGWINSNSSQVYSVQNIRINLLEPISGT